MVAIVTGFTAERMLEIENTTIVGGFVDVNGELLLQPRVGAPIPAGDVRGPAGPSAYDLWLADGNTGSLEDFLETLRAKNSVRSVGEYFDWPKNIPIPSYGKARNGQALSRTAFGSYFAEVGVSHGAGDGSTTFNAPNDIVTRKVAQLLKTTAQNTPATNSTPAIVTWQSDEKASGMYNPAEPTKIKPNRKGRWLVTAKLRYGATGSAAGYLQVRMNGSGDLGSPSEALQTDGIGGPYPRASAYFTVTNPGTDYFEVWAYSTANTHSLVPANCIFSAEYIGDDVYEEDSPVIPCVIVTDQGSAAGVTIINQLPNSPIGSTSWWPSNGTIPSNSLLMEGQQVLVADHPGLAAVHPSWVSGIYITIPDMRGRAAVGWLSGDDMFGTMGAAIGHKELQAHTHTTLIRTTQTFGASAGSTIYSTDVGGTTPTGSTGTGNGKNIPPSRVGRWIVFFADSAGEYSPHVQAALTATSFWLKERVWEDVFPTSIVTSPTNALAVIDPLTGAATVPPGTIVCGLYGNLFEPGYQYEFTLNLGVRSGHDTDRSAWFRMVRDGVANVSAGYQTAGYWAQYNATGGVYTVSGGTGAAIGPVSGSAAYLDYNATVIFTPGFVTPLFLTYDFNSFTNGSARGARGGGYTPSAAVGAPFNGIYFYINSAVSEVFQGRIRVRRRKMW